MACPRWCSDRASIAAAIRTALAGRPGPVVLEIPDDVFSGPVPTQELPDLSIQFPLDRPLPLLGHLEPPIGGPLGELGRAGEPLQEHLPHQLERLHDLGIRQPVVRVGALASHQHHSLLPHHAEVLRDEVEARLASFGEAMDDDLNTPGALAALHELVSEGNHALEAGNEGAAAVARAALVEALDVLGVDLSGDDRTQELVGPLVELLLGQREEARKRKDFEAADEIRARLGEMGITVEDSPQGPRWFSA